MTKKNFKLIVTVGPSVLKKGVINRIAKSVCPIFRINGAHGTPEYLEDIIDDLRRIDRNASVLIDLPGSKIRIRDLLEPIPVKRRECFHILHTQLNYPQLRDFLKKGDIVLANDSNLKLEVAALTKRFIKFVSHSDGCLENNKGLHITGIHDNIPFLFEKDLELLNLAVKKHVDYIGLSFVRNAGDVKMVKDILDGRNSKIEIISKIEKIEALRNLREILRLTRYILIDRGDLSSETGLVHLPYYQREIIKAAKSMGVNIFIATQVLKNMQTRPIPLIAEAVDLYNILNEGVHGVQLSEETAIGEFPEECVSFIREMLEFTYKKPPSNLYI